MKSLFYLSTSCFLKLFFNIPLCHLYNIGKFISVQVIFAYVLKLVLYSHLNSWFILLNTSFFQSFKTDDSMRPFFITLFLCVWLLQGNIARAFFRDGFFKQAKQSNILCCFFQSPKSLHFLVEKISNNNFFWSGCFFPRVRKCGTIFLNVLEKLVYFTAPCISPGNCSKNNWYRSFRTLIMLRITHTFTATVFYFFKNIIAAYFGEAHDRGSIIDIIHFTSSSKKYKIVYWRSLYPKVIISDQKVLNILDKTFFVQEVQVQSFQSNAWNAGVLGETLLPEILAFFKPLGIMWSRPGRGKSSCDLFWRRGLTLQQRKSFLKNAIITNKDNIFRIKNRDRK